jgi:hypothetical protein
MTHKKKHQGSNSALTKSNPGPTCMAKMKPFFENLPIYQNMAAKLQIDADFLLALSSKESGWLEPHNQKLRNLFGVTNAGGPNLAFVSYQKSADFWVKHFGEHVKGARTMDDFAEGLKKAHYNTKNPKYYTELKDQLETIIKYKKACGITPSAQVTP